MRAIIFANGEISLPVQIQPDDTIIAADGGALHCMKLGMWPSVVIGDLDSLSAEDIEKLKSRGAQILDFPARKDYTDLELAIQYTRDLQPDEILVYGALGSRWDQTAANLLLAGAYEKLPIRLVDGNQEFFYITAGMSRSIDGKPGDTVSLVPLRALAEGITTRNLEYPLNGENLEFGSTRGISNVLVEPPAVISLQKGLLLCIVIHH